MCSPFNYNMLPTPNCSGHRSRSWLLQHSPTLLTLQMLSESVQSSTQTGKRVSSMDSGLDFYWDRGTAAGKPLIFPLSFLREKSLLSVTFFQSVIIQTLFALLHSSYYFEAFIQKDGFKLHSSLKALHHLPSIPPPPLRAQFDLQTRAVVHKALSFPTHMVTGAQILMEGEKQIFVIKAKVKLMCFSDGASPLLPAQPSDSFRPPEQWSVRQRLCTKTVYI